MDAGTQFSIIEGSDRLDALRISIEKCPGLADKCVSIQVYADPGGRNHSCILSDIRRFDHPIARSAQIAIDDRDDLARMTRDLVDSIPVFRDSIEMTKTSISNRSRKLFTLSALYHANCLLLADTSINRYAVRRKLAIEFWSQVARLLPEWSVIGGGKTSAAEIRANFIHCHAIGIAAIARAGRTLLKLYPTAWKRRLELISTLDWSRSNTAAWEGTAMIGGRLSKSTSAIVLAGNVVKRHLGLEDSLDD